MFQTTNQFHMILWSSSLVFEVLQMSCYLRIFHKLRVVFKNVASWWGFPVDGWSTPVLDFGVIFMIFHAKTTSRISASQPKSSSLVSGCVCIYYCFITRNIINMHQPGLVGGLNPSENMKVNWDDNRNPIVMGQFKKWQPNHQPVINIHQPEGVSIGAPGSECLPWTSSRRGRPSPDTSARWSSRWRSARGSRRSGWRWGEWCASTQSWSASCCPSLDLTMAGDWWVITGWSLEL